MKLYRTPLLVLCMLTSAIAYSSQEALTQFTSIANQAGKALPELADLMNKLKNALVDKNYDQVAQIAKTAQEGQGIIPSSLTSFFGNGIETLSKSLLGKLKDVIPDSLLEKGGVIGSVLKVFRDKSIEQLAQTNNASNSINQLSQLQISDPAKFAQDLKSAIESGQLKPSALGTIASQTTKIQKTLGSMEQAATTATQEGLFDNLQKLITHFTGSGAKLSLGDIGSLMSELKNIQSLFSQVATTSSTGSRFLGSMISSFGPALLNQVSPSLASTLAPALQMLKGTGGGFFTRFFNWITGR